jgi:hypothetical protein
MLDRLKKRVLFLCTGNAARSQMAEALARADHGEILDPVSAGSRPAGFVHPLAIRAIEALGMSMDGARSKGAGQFRNEPLTSSSPSATRPRRTARRGPARRGSSTGRSRTRRTVQTIPRRGTTGSSPPGTISAAGSTIW